MIARPPEKKPSFSVISASPSSASKVANDNQPPQRHPLGWVLLMLGLFLLIIAFFQIYEKI